MDGQPQDQDIEMSGHNSADDSPLTASDNNQINRIATSSWKSVADSFENIIKVSSSYVTSIPTVQMQFGGALTSFANQLASNTDYMASMEGLVAQSKQIADTFEQIKTSYFKSFEPIIKSFDAISKHLDDITRNFREQLQSLNIPKFSFEQYEAAYLAWGSCGWMLDDHLPISILLTIPHSVSDADALMGRFFNQSNLEILFSSLLDTQRRKDDVKEAIWLFKQRRYKPCAMMLFSLIDSRLLLHDHPRPNKNGFKARRTSKNAVSTMLENVSRACFDYYGILGLNKAYEYFFKPGDDFNRANEGEINRNFLQHGMMYKRVKRLSCIKLFVMLNTINGLISHS